MMGGGILQPAEGVRTYGIEYQCARNGDRKLRLPCIAQPVINVR